MKTWIFICLLIFPSLSFAHKPSDSYLSLQVQQEKITGRWDIALRDLDYALGLDANDDGAITWGEVRSREAEITGYAMARLTVQAGPDGCPLTALGLKVDEHTDGHYAVLVFQAQCPQALTSLAIGYRLFFDLDPQHRGLLNLAAQGKTQTAVLGPQDGFRPFELETATDDELSTLKDFVREGIWHIWTGYDHILFLLSLLLPAVLNRQQGRWIKAASFRLAFWDVLKVVTAFTLAHSVTLSLAALCYVNLPSRWVESAIAASVVAAAINNILPLFQRRRPQLAFGFGLVHGLGFASVLSDLALPVDARLLGLVGFNLGVELGQLAIVGGFLPLAYGLSRHRFYEPAVLKVGSLAIALLAFGWLLERALDWKLMAMAGFAN